MKLKYPASAKLVKSVRENRKFSHEQLAKILNKNRTTIVNYEAGRINVPGDIILKLQGLLTENQKGAGQERSS